jgi:hypothetical protein
LQLTSASTYTSELITTWSKEVGIMLPIHVEGEFQLPPEGLEVMVVCACSCVAPTENNKRSDKANANVLII